MVERLVTMQAQNPLDPYVALWSRLDGFQPDELSSLIAERRAVRIGLLRNTLHLATADDARRLWPLFRPIRERGWSSSPFTKQLPGIDMDAVLTASRDLLEAQPQTTSALGKRLHERWPGHDPVPLGYVARFLLPTVQLPPRGLWGRSGRPTWTTLEAWTGQPLSSDETPDAAVLRYLGAFGPATVADIRIWSWLPGLREVVERLRPRLVTFRDEIGRELFDLPDAPRPDADTPAPPRFLPEYDNLLLSHDDRSRVIPELAIGRLTGWVGSFLVDGHVRGQWRIDHGKVATIIIEPFEALADQETDELASEAARLLEFMAPIADERRVEFGIAREAPTDDRPGIGGTRRRPPPDA
jgi:hypothetical protein